MKRKSKSSHLENGFLFKWRLAGGPTLTPELKFSRTRKWRFDFAHEESRTAIEIEGIWQTGRGGVGRHLRPMGFLADCEKYLEAGLMGWTIFRLSPPLITLTNCERIARFIEANTMPESPDL